MVRICAAYGCKNSAKTKTPLHKFPTNITYRRIWTRWVRHRRKDWAPSDGSVLCSDHFEKNTTNFYAEDLNRDAMGMAPRKIRLQPTAVPTLLVSTDTCSETRESSSCGRGRPASQIRERHKVVSALIEAQEETIKNKQIYEDVLEASEALLLLGKQNESSQQIPEHILSQETSVAGSSSFSQSFEESIPYSPVESIACQASITPMRRSRGVQTATKLRSVGTDTFREFRSIGIQCEMLKVPANMYSSDCESEDTDDEMNDCSSNDDPSFEYADTDMDVSFSSENSCGETVPPYLEPKYIVFESCLLKLFQQCPACQEETVGQIKHQIGSQILIAQKSTEERVRLGQQTENEVSLPPPLSTSCVHPSSKEEAVQRHKSRFRS